MLLPNKLPKKLTKKTTQPEPKMVNSPESRNSTNPNSPITKRPASLVARSWARISKRKRKKNLPQNREDVTQIPSTSASATRLDHIDQTSVELMEDSEARKKHFLNRGMDKLRRSFRKSFRRSSSSKTQALTPSASPAKKSSDNFSNGVNSTPESSNSAKEKDYCHIDEAAVRSAACCFMVKYLGCCEVYEPRGMHICEAILYVSGDGIRVVDRENNRGLILDQTIEKVSFCSPDRHNDKGFGYICRDGASRRWLCHGFQAMKESGERLSHAVGCAFNVCLEKKRKRDAQTAAYASAQTLALSTNSARFSDPSLNVSSARGQAGYSSFRRQLSIAERRLDPQTAIISEPKPPPLQAFMQQQRNQQNSLISNSFTAPNLSGIAAGQRDLVTLSKENEVAKPRPFVNTSLFERQGSIKTSMQNSLAQPVIDNSFKRFSSLRTDPSANPLNRPVIFDFFIRFFKTGTLYNEPIYEGDYPYSSSENCSDITKNWQKFNSDKAANLDGITNAALQDNTPLRTALRPIHTTNTKSTADEWLNQAFRASLIIPSTKSSPKQSRTDDSIPSPSSSIGNQAQQCYIDRHVPHSFSVPDSSSFGTTQLPQSGCYLENRTTEPPAFPPPPLPPGLLKTLKGNNTNKAATLEVAKPNSTMATQKVSPIDVPYKTQVYGNASTKYGDNNAQTIINDSTNNVSGHSKKPSGSLRMSIEYQILEETDVPPQSPPRRSSEQNSTAAIVNLTKSTTSPYSNDENDPFDVHWLKNQQFSSEVMKKISDAHQKQEMQNFSTNNSIATTQTMSSNLTETNGAPAITNPFFSQGSVNV